MNLQAYFQKMTTMNLPSSIFVDCTSSEEVAGLYETILDSNIAIVTPNKKANSGSFQTYQQLKKTSRQRGVRFLYETNVGAGSARDQHAE
jgi:aspartokinase/homoserine dehydrogenase 1